MGHCVAVCELDSLMPVAVDLLAASGQLQKVMDFLTKAPVGPNDRVDSNWVEDGQKIYRPWIPKDISPAGAVTLMMLDKRARKQAGKMIGSCPDPVVADIKAMGDRGLIDKKVLTYALKWGIPLALRCPSSEMGKRLNALADAVEQFLYDGHRELETEGPDDVTERLGRLDNLRGRETNTALLNLDDPAELGVFHAMLLAGAFKFASRLQASDERRNVMIKLALACVGEVVADAVPAGSAIISPIRFAVDQLVDLCLDKVAPPREWKGAFKTLAATIKLKVSLSSEHFVGGQRYTASLDAAMTVMTENG